MAITYKNKESEYSLNALSKMLNVINILITLLSTHKCYKHLNKQCVCCHFVVDMQVQVILNVCECLFLNLGEYVKLNHVL